MVVSGSRGSGKKTVLELIAGVILTGNNGKMFVPPHLRLLHVAKEPQSIPELDIFSIMAAKFEVFMGGWHCGDDKEWFVGIKEALETDDTPTAREYLTIVSCKRVSSYFQATFFVQNPKDEDVPMKDMKASCLMLLNTLHLFGMAQVTSFSGLKIPQTTKSAAFCGFANAWDSNLKRLGSLWILMALPLGIGRFRLVSVCMLYRYVL